MKRVIVLFFFTVLFFDSPAAESAGHNDEENRSGPAQVSGSQSSREFLYYKAGYGAFLDFQGDPGPLLGVGWRKEFDGVIVDMSIASLFTTLEYDTLSSSHGLYAGFFGLGFYHLFAPVSARSLYFGGGISSGIFDSNLSNETNVSYQVVITAVLGYEILRNYNTRLFIQLEINYTVLAMLEQSSDPFAIVTVGFGF